MDEFLAQGGEKAPRKEKKEKKAAKDPNAPKKPAGGGYGVFLAENRDRFKASLPQDHKITDISKKAGEEWKKLPEAKQKPYVAKYEQKMAAYKASMDEFLAQGGEKAPRKEKKEKKAAKDPNAPKKPAGGGYGVFLAENRDRFKASLP